MEKVFGHADILYAGRIDTLTPGVVLLKLISLNFINGALTNAKWPSKEIHAPTHGYMDRQMQNSHPRMVNYPFPTKNKIKGKTTGQKYTSVFARRVKVYHTTPV